jgi:hypothetical protein
MFTKLMNCVIFWLVLGTSGESQRPHSSSSFQGLRTHFFPPRPPAWESPPRAVCSRGEGALRAPARLLHDGRERIIPNSGHFFRTGLVGKREMPVRLVW